MTTLSSIKIPLGKTAHARAGKLAVEYDDPIYRRQVYLNTLAVYAVHRYLQWFEVVSNLEASDSSNPGLLGYRNVADLVIPQLGRIECRPMLIGTGLLEIPEEATESEQIIACIGVGLDEDLEYGYLLGFKRTIELSDGSYNSSPSKLSRNLPLQELETMDDLFSYLNYIQEEFRLLPETENLALFQESHPKTSTWTSAPFLSREMAKQFRLIVTADQQQLQKDYKIPDDCYRIERNIQLTNYAKPIALSALFWQSKHDQEELLLYPKWSLLLILSRENKYLPEGVQMTVLSGQAMHSLDSQTTVARQKFLYVYGATDLSDTLIVTIGLNGQNYRLPPFEFRAKID